MKIVNAVSKSFVIQCAYLVCIWRTMRRGLLVTVCVKYYTTLCVNKGEFMCACVCVCMRERGREGGSE